MAYINIIKRLNRTAHKTAQMGQANAKYSDSRSGRHGFFCSSAQNKKDLSESYPTSCRTRKSQARGHDKTNSYDELIRNSNKHATSGLRLNKDASDYGCPKVIEYYEP